MGGCRVETSGNLNLTMYSFGLSSSSTGPVSSSSFLLNLKIPMSTLPCLGWLGWCGTYLDWFFICFLVRASFCLLSAFFLLCPEDFNSLSLFSCFS